MILDTGIPIPATFMNSNFVSKRDDYQQPLTMSTNAGAKKMNLCDDMELFGPFGSTETKL